MTGHPFTIPSVWNGPDGKNQWVLHGSNNNRGPLFDAADVPRIHAELSALMAEAEQKGGDADASAVRPSSAAPREVASAADSTSAPAEDPYRDCADADAAPLTHAGLALHDVTSALDWLEWAATGTQYEREATPDITSLRDAARAIRPLLRELEKLCDRLDPLPPVKEKRRG